MAKRTTGKQAKLLKLITENFGKEKPLSMYEMMLLSGFSEESARQQSNVLAGIQEELQPIVKRLETQRDEAVKALALRLPRASYRDLIDAVDKLTKNIQLLSGGKTSNDKVTLTWADAPSSNPIQPEAMGPASS